MSLWTLELVPAARRSCGNNQMQQRHALKPDDKLGFTLWAAAIPQSGPAATSIPRKTICEKENLFEH